jgi:hypothetical protein
VSYPPFDRGSELLQRTVDAGEGAIEVRAEAVDGRDDGKRNTGRDEAVFDGGGAFFVVPKLPNKLTAKSAPVST